MARKLSAESIDAYINQYEAGVKGAYGDVIGESMMIDIRLFEAWLFEQMKNE